MDPSLIKLKAHTYLLLGQDIAELEKQRKRLQEELAEPLDEAPENSRGSKVLLFHEPIKVGGVEYKSLQRVRKESKTLHEDRVFKYLASLPEEDTKDWNVVQSRQYIDQDALWNVFCLDLIDDETFESFFDRKISWAFSPTKV